MKNALEWVNYVTKILDALSEGLKVVVDKWPPNRPGSEPAKKE